MVVAAAGGVGEIEKEAVGEEAEDAVALGVEGEEKMRGRARKMEGLGWGRAALGRRGDIDIDIEGVGNLKAAACVVTPLQHRSLLCCYMVVGK